MRARRQAGSRGSTPSGKAAKTGREEELQGRAGTELPVRERTMIAGEEAWQRGEEIQAPEQGPRRRSKAGADRVVEISYERGPGSKFQRAGRGQPKPAKRVKRAKRTKSSRR